MSAGSHGRGGPSGRRAPNGRGERTDRGESTGSHGAGGRSALAPAVAFAGRLREAVEGGAALSEAAARAALGLPRGVRDGLDRAARRLTGDYAEDDWGFDEDFTEAVYPLLEFMYARWWRVRTEGIGHVPAHGRALLVSNHGGTLPWDAAMIGTAVLREHPIPRDLRFLTLPWAFDVPYVSSVLRKVGGVAASPHNAIRLLEEDRLVAAFPEGMRSVTKPYSDRYRLASFGRGGFVDIALRTGAPIVPVAVVGSEEIYPRLVDPAVLARLARTQTFPITPTFPLLGPLGVVPLPARWRIEFCAPVDTASLGADAGRDRALVLELSERIRATIQAKLHENLVKRGSAFI